MNQKKLVNFSLFIAGWWVALLYGNALALIALFVVLMLHFVMWRDMRDIFLILGFIFCGFGVEWAFMANGVQDYRSNLPPAWAICIWAMLATTVRYSLGFLMRRPLHAALTGVIAAPLFYFNSVHFGPAGWGRPVWQCLLAIALVWGLLGAIISGVLVPLVEQTDSSPEQQVQ
ncbi:DUF2878 domain-containing protein [Microbulbifer aggregans]|uniref:DUF2878 domain-containing protein n=1 Tax=Microbulbifer aggregans TaxID=1769779 RepID=UPI001CFCBD1D|nr:DUF2878 domain-containing protein [Microbulbifer aggregans]